MARRARAREVSAGGVVLKGEDVVVIVPKRRAADGARVLGLPKGHLDGGEDALQAAAREVREETGVQAAPLGELGEVRYWYKRDGRSIPKSVRFFLFRYLSGSTEDHDHEIEEARWMPIGRASLELTYKGEREMVQLAEARLREGALER
jgi:8-oxo-dGTP pyrophosphatase MutT (NUDIX family)